MVPIEEVELKLGTDHGVHGSSGGKTVWHGSKDVLAPGGGFAFCPPPGSTLNGLSAWLFVAGFGFKPLADKSIAKIRAVIRARVTTGTADLTDVALRTKGFPDRSWQHLNLPLTNAFADYIVEWPIAVLLNESVPNPAEGRRIVSEAGFGCGVAATGKASKVEVDSIRMGLLYAGDSEDPDPGLVLLDAIRGKLAEIKSSLSATMQTVDEAAETAQRLADVLRPPQPLVS